MAPWLLWHHAKRATMTSAKSAIKTSCYKDHYDIMIRWLLWHHAKRATMAI